jgi:phytoene desaturase
MTQSLKAIIIGAGIAGIASAIRLRNLGFIVAVYESNSYAGGKLSEFSSQGYRFDKGPSLFTMPQFVEVLFENSNQSIERFFKYKKKKTVCNYFYQNGLKFSAASDVKLFATEASKKFDVQEDEILKYFAKSKQKYELTAPLFLEKSLHKSATYLNKKALNAVLNISKLDINKTLHQYNQSCFKDPKLVQLFDRFATYNGSSPYHTPGIMSMIPHLEQHFGTFFPEGGMYAITKSLVQLAEEIGVSFHYSIPVSQILVEDSRAVGIVANNEKIMAEVVVSNADIVPTYRKLLKNCKAPEKTLNQPRSSSALIFYWGIKAEFPALDLHNIFFSEEYEQEFQAIFNKNEVYKDPTIYINISSKESPLDAPKGCENWFVMINVPGNTGQDWDEIIKTAKTNIISKLNRLLNSDIESLIECETILDPRSIESQTQSYQGALYGASSNNKYAAFLRHPNFKQSIKSLYFCGGSVHPGGGIPLCLLSAKIVADMVKKDLF